MKKILCSNKYNWIVTLLLFLFIIISEIALIIFYFPHENSLLDKIIVIIFLTIFAAITFISFLFSFQYAILSIESITIRFLFRTIGCIKWTDITNVSISKINTAKSSIGISMHTKFITILTKNNKSYNIVFSIKNYNTIIYYIIKYATNVNLNDINNCISSI